MGGGRLVGAEAEEPVDLNEFAFRFNRRRSEFRGLLFRRLLEQAVQVGPCHVPIARRESVSEANEAPPSAARRSLSSPSRHLLDHGANATGGTALRWIPQLHEWASPRETDTLWKDELRGRVKAAWPRH